MISVTDPCVTVLPLLKHWQPSFILNPSQWTLHRIFTLSHQIPAYDNQLCLHHVERHIKRTEFNSEGNTEHDLFCLVSI